MCGIAGSFHRDGAFAGVAARGRLAQMVAALRHRGPDDVGVAVSGPLGLGHARLSILDLAGGRQPIWNEERTAAAVCNGEIYNHRALRARLERQGHRFRTETDTEVIVHLYEEMGDDCVPMFERLDLVVTPAAAALPWPAAEPFPPVIDGRPVGPRGHAMFTGWVNAAGLPALALPCEPSREGLPIGVQLIGGYGCDDALLALGESLQAQWRWPAI